MKILESGNRIKVNAKQPKNMVYKRMYNKIFFKLF